MIRVMNFVAHYVPSYRSGGPVRSVANLVEALGNDHAMTVVTRDRDALDTKPFAGVDRDCWVKVGRARTWYGSPRWFSPRRVRRLIAEEAPDIIFLNSLFDWKSGILPLIAMRGMKSPPSVILAPRGEMASGALALKSLKKRGWLMLGKALGLYRGVHFQAASSFSRDDILRQFPGSSVAVMHDVGPAPAPELFQPRTDASTFKVIHVARITPMKNLLFALRSLARCKAPLELTLIGPVRDVDYWSHCRAQILQLPAHIIVHPPREVPADAVRALMATHDLMFLPTRGEDFGHVVPEALSVGLPVLLSDRTPWRDLATKGLGWDLPLETGEKEFAACIDAYAAQRPSLRAAQRRRILDASSALTGRDDAIAGHRALFARLKNQASEGI